MTTAVLFIGGLVLLYLGGEGLVRSAAAIGMRIGMTPLVAGLTIVAFATSAPELAISVHAVLRGVPGLAVGNVIGSNICNITLILGVTALLAPPRLREVLVRRDVLIMVVATLLVPGLLFDGELLRPEGALLTVTIIGYIWLTVWHATSSRHIDPFESSTVPILSRHVVVNVFVCVASVGLLVLGSELFVRSSVEIAMALGVSSAVVGLSAAALATSLPELSACVVAARHGHPEMAAGNLIGSNIFNLLMILGVTSLVAPLEVGGVTIVDLVVMIATSMLAVALMLTKAHVDRAEGALLVLIYVGYQYWLFDPPGA